VGCIEAIKTPGKYSKNEGAGSPLPYGIKLPERLALLCCPLLEGLPVLLLDLALQALICDARAVKLLVPITLGDGVTWSSGVGVGHTVVYSLIYTYSMCVVGFEG
jgi:hypothetical protein